MQAIALLAPVMRKLGSRANPGNLKKVPLSAVALWAFYLGALQPDRLRLHMLSVCCCSLTSQLCAKTHNLTVWCIGFGLRGMNTKKVFNWTYDACMAGPVTCSCLHMAPG